MWTSLAKSANKHNVVVIMCMSTENALLFHAGQSFDTTYQCLLPWPSGYS